MIRMLKFGVWASVLSLFAVLGCNEAPPAPSATPTKADKAPAESAPATGSATSAQGQNDNAVGQPNKAVEKKSGDLKLSEKENAGKAAMSDGKSLAEAKRLVDVMEGELKRATAAMQLAGKDKERVKEIGDEFQRLNKGLSKKIEAISEKLTSEELVAYEDYARERVGPAVQSFIQTVFKLGGFNQAVNEQAKKATPSAPSTTPTAAAAPVINPVVRDPRVVDPKTASSDPLTLGTPKAASAPGGGQADGTNSVTFAVAKAAVDGMASELRGIVGKVKAAQGDSTKIKAISQEYKAINSRHASMFPKLIETMQPNVKAAFGQYVKSTLVPVSTELMAVFTESGMTLAE